MSDAEIEITTTQLLELEEQRRHALVNKDFDLLATLFADELVYMHSTGVVQDKPTYLAYAQNVLEFVSIDTTLKCGCTVILP